MAGKGKGGEDLSPVNEITPEIANEYEIKRRAPRALPFLSLLNGFLYKRFKWLSLANSDFVTITRAESIPDLHLKGRIFDRGASLS